MEGAEETKNGSRISWQALGLIAAILVFCILAFTQISSFVHIPSPVYGGDFYRDRGFSNSISIGNSVFSDPQYAGEHPYFPWLYYLLVAAANIFMHNIDKAFLFFPLLSIPLCAAGFYLLLKQLLKNKTFAALGAALILATLQPMISSPKWFATWVLLPFFLYFWMRNDESQKVADILLAGLFLGLIGMCHTNVFIGAAVIFILGVLAKAALSYLDEKKLKQAIIPALRAYFTALPIAFVVMLPFILPIALKYRFHILNNSNEYALLDVSKTGFVWLVKSTWSLFFNTSSVPAFIIGILALAGLIFSILNYKKQYVFPAVWLLSIIAGAGHHLVTIPLTGRFIVTPAHVFSNSYVLTFLLAAVGIKWVYSYLKKSVSEQAFAAAAIIVLIVPFTYISFNNYTSDRWVQYGKGWDSGTKALYDAGAWIEQNTDKSDIFIANDESAFALNALSGRKFAFLRRVHSSYFLDVNKKYADGFVILYGNNSELRAQLIREYNIKYLYIDSFLMGTPMLTDAKYASYLAENGVNFTLARVPWDPSSSDAPVYDSAIVYPQELKILNSTTVVQQFAIQGSLFAEIRKVKS